MGRLARPLAVDLSLIAALDATPAGPCWVHGDFGPQNLLLDQETAERRLWWTGISPNNR